LSVVFPIRSQTKSLVTIYVEVNGTVFLSLGYSIYTVHSFTEQSPTYLCLLVLLQRISRLLK